MLLPLEYSMSLRWVATPLWESDESESAIAASFTRDALAPSMDDPIAAADADPMPPREAN